MNKSGSGNIVTIILIFIIQIIFDEFLNIGSYCFITLIPLAVILAPRGIPMWRTMLSGFIFGLLFDMLSDGILGLNAAAAVMLCAVREYLYNLIISKDKSDKSSSMSLNNISLVRFVAYAAVCILIFLVTYILLDHISARNFMFFIKKLTFSLVANTVITVAICYLVHRK